MKEAQGGQYWSLYTWKHRQSSSVIGDPNRITRQARVLPSILKCYIGQVENFYLLICGVNTGCLREEEQEEEERNRGRCAKKRGRKFQRKKGERKRKK